MNDILIPLIRIFLRYIAAVLVTKGVENEPMIALLQDDTFVQTIAGIVIIVFTETSWLKDQIKRRSSQ